MAPCRWDADTDRQRPGRGRILLRHRSLHSLFPSQEDKHKLALGCTLFSVNAAVVRFIRRHSKDPARQPSQAWEPRGALVISVELFWRPALGCLWVCRMLWSFWDLIEVSGTFRMAAGAFPPHLRALFMGGTAGIWGSGGLSPSCYYRVSGGAGVFSGLCSFGAWALAVSWHPFPVFLGVVWPCPELFPSFGRVISGSLFPLPQFHLIAMYSV